MARTREQIKADLDKMIADMKPSVDDIVARADAEYGNMTDDEFEAMVEQEAKEADAKLQQWEQEEKRRSGV